MSYKKFEWLAQGHILVTTKSELDHRSPNSVQLELFQTCDPSHVYRIPASESPVTTWNLTCIKSTHHIHSNHHSFPVGCHQYCIAIRFYGSHLSPSLSGISPIIYFYVLYSITRTPTRNFLWLQTSAFSNPVEQGSYIVYMNKAVSLL